MSRAFVKEGDGSLDPLPDLPISPHPNYVTPTGLADLHSRLRARQKDLTALRARPDRLDRLPEAAAERDIRYLEARLRTAILVDPAQHSLDTMAFGLIATVVDAEGRENRYHITGEDEADPAQGRIAPHSPLARALMGAQVGDVVALRKPGGTAELKLLRIDHPGDQP